jgi:hypothetical protein
MQLGNDVAVMDLGEGFQIEDPVVFVPWGADEETLRSRVSDGLRTVATGYFTMECTSLSGLQHILGMHMSPQEGGTLHELEFFRRDRRDSSGTPSELAAGFGEWQHHLELAFGPPTKVMQGELDHPSYVWTIGPATVRHLCYERFGPEQHIRIARY